ncbi:MAG: nuclear transport factor 2 family protein [Selenomonas sp.]|uniref:nuclear transport factor 2 family protein n=1 Tax=Selenomonas sp. TaxID=2053611 RepID=UPI0025DCDF7C|nr:nuclear transport factor 2 family protein [Selenomonas sp.]MCI6084704.1 nuclear transport factor 2 family protein [Selenomonas sp.]
MGRTTQQYKAIEKVIEDYVTGTNGDVDLLKEKVFLPTALINGSPIAELYEIVKERGETHSTGCIDWADIQNGVASLRVLIEDWHGQDYVEYLQLLKENGRWTIISKAFDSYVDTFVI